jgi:hypothetical protein
MFSVGNSQQFKVAQFIVSLSSGADAIEMSPRKTSYAVTGK